MKLALVLCLSTIAAADPLRVEIKPAATTWKREQKIDVALVVTNPAKQPQTMKVMTCSWGDHWQSSDRELGWIGWPCDENGAGSITLEPGKSRAWKLEMSATKQARLGAHALQLTFTPDGLAPSTSNRVALTVTK